MSTFNSLSQTDRLEAKTEQLEVKLTAEIAALKSKMEANIDGCRAKSSDLYVDVAVLKSSHKFVFLDFGLIRDHGPELFLWHVYLNALALFEVKGRGCV